MTMRFNVDERYQELRREIESFFREGNRVPESAQSFDSPSGTFRLETCCYSTIPNHWNYSRGLVTRLDDGTLVADVKRNYGHFWHSWVEHADGNEYLLCGEDYQGYSIINLTAGTRKDFFPQSGYGGWGFCWTAAYPSPDSLVLAVNGCYWACPYEIVLYDFRKPDELPLPELARLSDILDPIKGWSDNETFVATREIEIRKSDGARYDSLDQADQAALDSDSALVEYRKEACCLKRPHA